MLNQIIEYSLKKSGLVVFLTALIIGFGVYSYLQIPVDAFPDISPVMVPVFAEAHGMAPEEIERLITWPIESAMNGLPGVTETKSTSAFGLAAVYVYFTDSTDIYFARQLVSERLSAAVSDLPALEKPPELGPISTGLGQVFIYYLKADPEVVETGGKSVATWLRELNDWVIKYQLQAVKGVTSVLSMGGEVLQYQIRVNPDRLLKFKISLSEIIEAIRNNNRNVGGQFVVSETEEHLVRGIGLLESIEVIKKIPLKTFHGTPVYLTDVAQVVFGNEVRRGAVTRNGEQEVVSGIVMKLFGENTSEVITRLHERIDQIRQTLPEGVEIVGYYDQAKLVKNATGTVYKALLQGGILIGIVLFVFLGNLKSALIVMLSLPVCALVAAIILRFAGVSANLMSLGGIAIAIGMLCDGSIVMVESILMRLDHTKNIDRKSLVLNAAKEVARPVLFSGVIIISVFLPLLTLEGVEGKMFSPMAFAIAAAMIGSLLVALVIVPSLSLVLLKNEKLEETSLVMNLKKIYCIVLKKLPVYKKWVVASAFSLLGLALIVGANLGTEFVPVLEEGSIFIGTTMTPSISLEEAVKMVLKMEKDLKALPEVKEIVSRIGRPEAGSHPHPVNYAEIQIELVSENKWRPGVDKQMLIKKMEEKLKKFPGAQFNFTQPIQNAFDELVSGVKTQLAIKVFGENLDILQAKAKEVKETIKDVPGLVDLMVEQSFGQPQILVEADREKCSRYGIDVSRILNLIETAVGGEVIDSMFVEMRRFAIHLRYQENFRDSAEAIQELLIATPDDQLILLSQVANVKIVNAPVQINRENNMRRWTVMGNIRGSDLGTVVAEIRRLIREKVTLPVGYHVEFGGQFENQQRAMLKLAIIVPGVILAVFVLLWLSFNSFRHALIIFTMVPLSVTGGVFGLWVMNEFLSVPASIGFIALFGMAMLDGMVMLSCFNHLRVEGKDLWQTVLEGCQTRLPPVLATTVTTLLGLLPLLLASGPGAEIQRPLASVVVFGLFSSTFLTLVVIPSIYLLIEERELHSS